MLYTCFAFTGVLFYPLQGFSVVYGILIIFECDAGVGFPKSTNGNHGFHMKPAEISYKCNGFSYLVSWQKLTQHQGHNYDSS